MIQVLEPRYMGKYCTLIEAVNWIAFKVFPYGIQSELKGDKEFMEWYIKYIEKFYIINDDYLKVFGRIQHPEIEYYFEEPNTDRTYLLNIILNSEYVSQEEKNKLSQENISGFIAWQDSMESILSSTKNEIIYYITKGKIKSYGVRLEKLKQSNSDLIDWKKSENWQKCNLTEQDYKHEEIPMYFWNPAELNLLESKIYSPEGCYGHIIITTEDLFKFFPVPEKPEVVNVNKIGESYFINSDDEEYKPIIKGNRGAKPKYNWDEFTQELARMTMNNELPDIKDNCIYTMKDWCEKNNWQQIPSETMIKEKIKPFYLAKKSVNNKE